MAAGFRPRLRPPSGWQRSVFTIYRTLRTGALDSALPGRPSAAAKKKPKPADRSETVRFLPSVFSQIRFQTSFSRRRTAPASTPHSSAPLRPTHTSFLQLKRWGKWGQTICYQRYYCLFSPSDNEVLPFLPFPPFSLFFFFLNRLAKCATVPRTRRWSITLHVSAPSSTIHVCLMKRRAREVCGNEEQKRNDSFPSTFLTGN